MVRVQEQVAASGREVGGRVFVRDVEHAGTEWAFGLAEKMGDSVGECLLRVTDGSLVHPSAGAGEFLGIAGCRLRRSTSPSFRSRIEEERP